MKINGEYYRTIWVKKGDDRVVQAIDQRRLPHRVVIEDLRSAADVAASIREMHVRGAGLIGAAAGYGMYLAALQAPRESEEAFMKVLAADGNSLIATRPTAVNLEWAVQRALREIGCADGIDAKIAAARRTADAIADEDADSCRRIGESGVKLIEEIAARKGGEPVNILTHCNAGWLAFVDYGTATAPVYEAQRRGIRVHVYVDETRPRCQGAQLTAFELGQSNVPHTIIADNAGGHLMQHGMVDMVIVGSDRTTCTGDVANKIGTYLKAVAAHENHVPFYVALPSSTIDWSLRDGVREIPIETRDENEIKYITGINAQGNIETVLITPEGSPAANYGFDVTPARYVTALITERGVCAATEEGIRGLFPHGGAHG
ncbi:MAG: S-methyl-5-thioribose-1-phosphate isomerase [Clostridia bacterium]|nr:S-methyl-5-thioribose-1-phosphate isomerase [Clostridia bacterium]